MTGFNYGDKIISVCLQRETKPLALSLYNYLWGGTKVLDRLEGKKVVGLKQSLKAIKSGSAKTVYIAKDADAKIYDQIKSAAEEYSLEIILIDTMKDLGRLCGIDVGAATAVTMHE